MFGIFKKIFGTAQQRTLKKYRKIVDQINRFDQEYQALTDEQLRAKTQEFRERLAKGENLDNLLPEAYATVKNACRRMCGKELHVFGSNQKWDMIPYDVQLLGAIAMHFGSIAEMQTGEGKTLTATLPLYLNALTGQAVHLVTVNDYLVQRDCEWMGAIFRWLGLTVGALTNAVAPHERKQLYACDIVYGTASEFGFDYLRDNSTAMRKEQQVQRGFYYAIVDEIDSILIDEARTPLIISGPVPDSRQMYEELKEGVSLLVRLQRDLCNRLATEAQQVLDKMGCFEERAEERSALSKAQEAQKKEALRKLWLVSKGLPRHKVLKRARENSDLREGIDDWDLYYVSDQNKEERQKVLAELYVTVDERGNEYELTDRGIAGWSEKVGGAAEDFVMLDLGYEYAAIDRESSLSEEAKRSKRLALQDEDVKRKERAHNLRQLLRAHLLMEKDVDYIVQDNKIVIIDENTGRPQPGRRFSDGLHQAIEAKENVAVQKETQTYATITLQNYFRMYKKLAGMSGTAVTEAGEFKEIYKLEVLEIPPHVPGRRKDAHDEVYMTEREKYNAILKEVMQIHGQGRPILIGTESVEISEKLSRIFRMNKLPHTVLNAKHHEKEAEIIAEAGKRAAITIATNMAGRGTDIKLKDDVASLGGLHVIGTTRHHSRRIDRQLRGRCARQGDEGSSKFYVSFEDTLLRLFASGRLNAVIKRFRPPEGEAISAGILNRAIETAQKRVEQRNYTIRKHTLEYDDVMNKQRQEIYAFRNEVLQTEEIEGLAVELLETLCATIAEGYLKNRSEEGAWDPEGYRSWLMTHFPVAFAAGCFDEEHLTREQIVQQARQALVAAFHEKLGFENQKQFRFPRGDTVEVRLAGNEAVRQIMVRKIDELWQEHLLVMDHLRAEVHLRVVGGKDPLLEFKEEAFMRFAELSQHLRLEIAQNLFKFEVVSYAEEALQRLLHQMTFEKERSLVAEMEERQASVSEQPAPQAAASPVVEGPKVGRNDDCPCGSGKKYKKCCGIALEQTE